MFRQDSHSVSDQANSDSHIEDDSCDSFESSKYQQSRIYQIFKHGQVCDRNQVKLKKNNFKSVQDKNVVAKPAKPRLTQAEGKKALTIAARKKVLAAKKKAIAARKKAVAMKTKPVIGKKKPIPKKKKPVSRKKKSSVLKNKSITTKDKPFTIKKRTLDDKKKKLVVQAKKNLVKVADKKKTSDWNIAEFPTSSTSNWDETLSDISISSSTSDEPRKKICLTDSTPSLAVCGSATQHKKNAKKTVKTKKGSSSTSDEPRKKICLTDSSPSLAVCGSATQHKKNAKKTFKTKRGITKQRKGSNIFNVTPTVSNSGDENALIRQNIKALKEEIARKREQYNQERDIINEKDSINTVKLKSLQEKFEVLKNNYRNKFEQNLKRKKELEKNIEYETRHIGGILSQKKNCEDSIISFERILKTYEQTECEECGSTDFVFNIEMNDVIRETEELRKKCQDRLNSIEVLKKLIGEGRKPIPKLQAVKKALEEEVNKVEKYKLIAEDWPKDTNFIDKVEKEAGEKFEKKALETAPSYDFSEEEFEELKKLYYKDLTDEQVEKSCKGITLTYGGKKK